MTVQIPLDAVLERIAKIAAIPRAKNRAFKDAAFFAVCFAEWSSAGDKRRFTPRDRKSMRAIAKAAIALDTALTDRTRLVGNALLAEWLMRQRKLRGKDASAALTREIFSNWLTWPRTLAELAGYAPWNEINRSGQDGRGAPKGFRNALAYELATGLRNAAKQCGGKLTIDKTMGTGSLLTALELCKPLFQNKFQVPSAMTLARMSRKTPDAPPKRHRSKNRKLPAKNVSS